MPEARGPLLWQVRPSAGPYPSGAFLCERVLEERDGVLSAIRIVDRILVQGQAPPGAEAPPMPSIGIGLMALIMLKNGAARGSRRLRLVPRAPSGLDVPLDGELLTRMPLRVVYQVVTTTAPPRW
ncbi:MAG TPA: hypothetical protein VFD01_12010 [Candidatus Dormibacteraeota bacterium]|jgi:hypothetical protein|nr:hypothetical protein [Candidatus Dormibacteraeota bacterium]